MKNLFKVNNEDNSVYGQRCCLSFFIVDLFVIICLLIFLHQGGSNRKALRITESIKKFPVYTKSSQLSAG